MKEQNKKMKQKRSKEMNGEWNVGLMKANSFDMKGWSRVVVESSSGKPQRRHSLSGLGAGCWLLAAGCLGRSALALSQLLSGPVGVLGELHWQYQRSLSYVLAAQQPKGQPSPFIQVQDIFQLRTQFRLDIFEIWSFYRWEIFQLLAKMCGKS